MISIARLCYIPIKSYVFWVYLYVFWYENITSRGKFWLCTYVLFYDMSFCVIFSCNYNNFDYTTHTQAIDLYILCITMAKLKGYDIKHEMIVVWEDFVTINSTPKLKKDYKKIPITTDRYIRNIPLWVQERVARAWRLSIQIEVYYI